MAGKNSSEEARARSLANLKPKPINERPVEEQKEICRSGQRASLAVVKRKRALRDICNEMLAIQCPEGAASLGELEQAAKDAANERGQALDVYEAAALAQIAKAMRGDTGAFIAVRDSAGDKPADNVRTEVSEVTNADLELLRKLDASGELEKLLRKSE